MTRSFDKLSDYAAEVINARVYDGVHYRTSGEVGADMGRRIGEHTVQNHLSPVRKMARYPALPARPSRTREETNNENHNSRSIPLVVGACLAAATVWAQHDSHTIIMPNDIKWADVPSLPPGAKIAVLEGKMNEAGPITARLKFPANYKVPAHFHPGVERVTVLSGTMNFGMGDKLDPKKTTAVGPGACSSCRPRCPISSGPRKKPSPRSTSIGPWTVTYVNPADDPRKK